MVGFAGREEEEGGVQLGEEGEVVGEIERTDQVGFGKERGVSVGPTFIGVPFDLGSYCWGPFVKDCMVKMAME